MKYLNPIVANAIGTIISSIQAGIPAEEDVMNSSVAVFSFPQKAPEKALYKRDIDAISHLNLWLIYQRHWCEHKPSVTISVKEEEWPTVGAWVWEHFEELSGVSFLPYDGGIYRQPPYESVTKEQYDDLVKKMPKKLNWDDLVETEDETEGVQTRGPDRPPKRDRRGQRGGSPGWRSS